MRSIKTMEKRNRTQRSRGLSALLLAVGLLLCLLLTACGKSAAATRVVHCDRCGKELTVEADSNMTDGSWIIYCSDCEKALGLDTIVPEE